MPAAMNSSATSAWSATVTTKAGRAIAHWNQSSMPSFASRQQE